MADKTNNTWQTWRNVANTADINVLKVDNNDDTYLQSDSGDDLYINAGSGGSIQMGVGGAYSYSINSGGMTVVEGKAIDSYGNGFWICSSSGIKMAFWGATRTAQPANTQSTRQVLEAVGLVAGGGADVAELVAHGNTSTTETFDASAAVAHSATLDANCTFTFTNPTAGARTQMELYVKQDGTGGRTVTWPASVDWAAGSTPTLSTAANALDVFVFTCIDAATPVWLGNMAGRGYA